MMIWAVVIAHLNELAKYLEEGYEPFAVVKEIKGESMITGRPEIWLKKQVEKSDSP